MKKVGFILICIGISILLLIIIRFWQRKDKIYSPIPDQSGVKVIPLSPTRER